MKELQKAWSMLRRSPAAHADGAVPILELPSASSSKSGSRIHTFSIWRSLTSCQNCVYVRRFIRSGRQVVCGACSVGMSHFAGSETDDLRTSILRPFLFVAARSPRSCSTDDVRCI